MEENKDINCMETRESAALMKNIDMEIAGLGQETEGLHKEPKT